MSNRWGALQRLLKAVIKPKKGDHEPQVLTTIEKVFYSDDIYGSPHIGQSESKMPDVHRLHLQKRMAFSYEGEVRGLVSFATGEGEMESTIDIQRSNIETENIDLTEFIDEAMIDPRAHSKSAEAISSYCHKNGINHIRSSLYSSTLEHEVDNSDLDALKKVLREAENNSDNNKSKE